jgi:hypothetical protein
MYLYSLQIKGDSQKKKKILQSVLVHSANCVKDVYSGMQKSAQ